MFTFISALAVLALLLHPSSALLRSFASSPIPGTLSRALGFGNTTQARGSPLSQNASTARTPYIVTLDNFLDAQYTANMFLGGQKLKVIIDTGSFELVVMSTSCTTCGRIQHLYNDSFSETLSISDFEAVQTYGSGTLMSAAAYDTVTFANASVEHQFFWLVKNANMDILQDDSFAGILGVGPPSSVANFAEYELKEIQATISELGRFGPTNNDQLVEQYQKTLELAKTTMPLLASMEEASMGVCLGKESGTHGYFIWNDIAPIQYPDMFVDIPVVGDFYWSSTLSDVNVDIQDPSRHDKDESGASGSFGPKMLGCSYKRCSAVLDTGNTLIMAPGDVVDRLNDIMYDWEKAGGTCDDLSSLPTLQFNFGGVRLELPPEAYAARVTGNFQLAKIKDFLPHVHARHMNRKNNGISQKFDCVSLLSPMDVESQFGPLWILGMAFFRHYYTDFTLGQGKVPSGSMMRLSMSDAECRPSQRPGVLAQEEDANLMRVGGRARAGTGQAQINLDLSKIQISTLANRIRTQSSFSNDFSHKHKKPFVHI